jgi:Glycosyltransferase family 87
MTRSRLALAAGLVALACIGGCVAVAWPHDSTLVPRNAGQPVGWSTWAVIFLACLATGFAAYALGVFALERWGGRLAAVAVIAAAIQLAPLGAPLLLSTDAWTYWDYGRIAAVHGGNPYRDPPNAFRSDPAFPHVGSGWRGSTSVYGPAFTLPSEPIALAAGSSAGAAAWIYKTIAALAVLAAAGMAAFLARRKALALAFVGWNPVLAIGFGGSGHNDVWMAALVMGALAAAVTARRQAAGAFWAAATLVKWIPLVFLPLRALEARAQGRKVGHLGFAAAVAVLGGVATWQFGWSWFGVFGPLARNANKETSYAIPHRLSQLGLPHWLALALPLAAFALGYLWLLRHAWGGRARLGLAAAMLLLATPYVAPWYTVWAVPLAAAEEDRTARLLTLVVCGYLLAQRIPV